MIQRFLFFLSLCFSLSSFAFVGAISTATAGSGRAAFDMTEAPLANPAAIAFLQGYFFNSGYGFMDNGNLFHVSLTDNLPDTLLPSSLQYAQQNQLTSSKQDWSTQNLRYAFGNYVMNTFAMGIELNHQIDRFPSQKYTQTNLMIGTLFSLTPTLAMAVVFDNIVDPDKSIPTAYRFQPSTAVGLAYNYKKFMRVRLDLETSRYSNSFNQPSFAAAVESYWNRWMVIRVSARKELETKLDEYGGGLGFVGPKFALHYGYLNCPQDEKLTRHAVDLAIPIW